MVSDLLRLPAARSLHLQNASTTLRAELRGLLKPLVLKELELNLFIPLVQKIVDEAPDTEIWSAVYELITLSKSTKTKILASHTRGLSQTSDILRALQKDWNSSYFPHSLWVLRELIRQYQQRNAKRYYAKTLVFVQSSGMGKSRLADAFGEFCPMINFILREPETSGFPAPDHEILEFLRYQPPRDILELVGKPEGPDGSSDSLKRRAGVTWNHTLAVALLQASCETCKLTIHV